VRIFARFPPRGYEGFATVRPRLLLLLVVGFLVAGCAADYRRETGITCTDAIRIAREHNVRHPVGGEYPHGNPFRNVERADWDAAKNVWVVDLMAQGGNYGRQYRVNSVGSIVGYKIVDRGSRNYYGPDLSDDDYHRYEGDDGYGNVRNDEALSPVGENSK
jgi:hypothetical protein